MEFTLWILCIINLLSSNIFGLGKSFVSIQIVICFLGREGRKYIRVYDCNMFLFLGLVYFLGKVDDVVVFCLKFCYGFLKFMV